MCSLSTYCINLDDALWEKHAALTNRLSTELYKIGLLDQELINIENILNDLRDLQILPISITHLNDDAMIGFDKNIEQKEKMYQEIVEKLKRIRMPLADAIAILREMVIGESIEDMFVVLEQGDMKRLTEIITVKHLIDQVWKDIDTTIESINLKMGLSPFEKDSIYGIDRDFFEIINSILGVKTQVMYEKLNIIKNSLIQRCTALDKRQLYKIELHRIKEAITNKKIKIAKRKIQNMRQRYPMEKNQHELNILLTKVLFMLGEYGQTIDIVNMLPDKPGFISEKVLYYIQSLFALEEYEKIWEWGETFDFTYLIGQNKNLIIWLVMESGYELRKDADFSKLASLMDEGSPYYLNIFHILARYYKRYDQIETMVSIYEKVTKKNDPENDIDKISYRRIQLAYAQVLFDIGNYERSIKQFFTLLNNPDYFEEASFGISWCYLKMGRYKEAEITLRKLINQSPQSHRSAEAILTMSKRLVTKSQFEWAKTSFLTREELKLKNTLLLIQHKLNQIPVHKIELRQKYSQALAETKKMHSQLMGRKKETYAGIRSYFTQAITICDMVSSHYETGSFQEITFSKKREKILHTLDSLMVTIKTDKSNIRQKKVAIHHQKKMIKNIKDVVKKSYVLKGEIEINLYNWESEYLNWKKLFLNDMEKYITLQLNDAKDLLIIDSLTRQREKIIFKTDSLVLVTANVHTYWYHRLDTLLNKLLKITITKNDEVYFRYLLGELYYLNENRAYALAYRTYEDRLYAYDSLNSLPYKEGINPNSSEPEIPRIDHHKSMDQFQTILSNLKSGVLVSNTQYSLAWCYNDLGLYDSAVSFMKLVVTNDTCPFTPHAWMFLGEYFFDNGKLDSAVFAYRSVMKYPECDLFDDALYKLAWSQYRLSNPKKAISSFLALVDLGKSARAGRVLLEDESLDYIAISFSESDITGEKGLQRAVTFCKKLNDNEKSMQILHRLGNVFDKQGRYEIAIKTYRTLLAMYPKYYKSPVVESSIIRSKGSELSLEESNKAKIELFEKYNKTSSWSKNQHDSSIVYFADSIASVQLYDASVEYHQLALSTNDSNFFHKAMKAYALYINHYPLLPKTVECHYNLAEILFSIGDYFKASEEYINVSKKYSSSKYKENAAWNAIVASQKLLTQENTQ